MSRKHRKLFAVVAQRARLADSLTKQLLALRLDRAAPKPLDLNTYIAAKYGSSENGDPTPADTAKEP